MQVYGSPFWLCFLDLVSGDRTEISHIIRHRGYYMPACGYEFYLRVFRISRVSAANVWGIKFPASRGLSRRGKMKREETSIGFRRIIYHACAGVSLTTGDFFVTCDTTREPVYGWLQYINSRGFKILSLLFLPVIHALRLISYYPRQVLSKF